MKFLLTLFFSTFIIANVSAFSSIHSIELNDSNVINAEDITIIELNDSNTINAFEISSGEVINASEIKKVNFIKPNSNSIQMVRRGGGDSGD